MAFSFHLFWDLALPAYEAAVTLEILEPPLVDRLYFWALQATFLEGATARGAGHLGLQWNPRFPDHKAANWGGYDTEGAVFPGSESPLPSTPRDPNTRDFPWMPRRSYRLRILPSPDQGWRGEITDVETGSATAVRDLRVGGDRLGRLMVWSELFCECSDPPSAVRWSQPAAIGLNGDDLVATAFKVNYQTDCPNIDVYSDDIGVVQATGTDRTTPHGALIPL